MIGRALSGDVLAFSPPLIITEAEIDEMLDGVAAALDELASQLRQENTAVVGSSEQRREGPGAATASGLPIAAAIPPARSAAFRGSCAILEDAPVHHSDRRTQRPPSPARHAAAQRARLTV